MKRSFSLAAISLMASMTTAQAETYLVPMPDGKIATARKLEIDDALMKNCKTPRDQVYWRGAEGQMFILSCVSNTIMETRGSDECELVRKLGHIYRISMEAAQEWSVLNGVDYSRELDRNMKAEAEFCRGRPLGPLPE